MDAVVLGPSGLRVSRLCLGTATFGNRDWGSDEAESRLILDHYLEIGGNFLDTANKYADGHSEQTLGRLLRGRRDRVVLATKYTASMDDGDLNSSGNHRKNLVASLEASLRRLQTDYVDILWMHAWDGVTPIEELMRALDDQVRAGKVGCVGISNAPSWMMAWANATAALRGWSPFVAVQGEYSLLERGAERELLPMARYFGLGYLAWAPIGQGRLTGKYSGASAGQADTGQASAGQADTGQADTGQRRLTPEEALMLPAQHQIVAENLAVARETGLQPAAVALRWIMQRQPFVIPVLGARSHGQFEANLACLDRALPADQMERLTAVSAIDPGSPARFMRGGPGRDFMWGKAGKVLPRLAQAREPWWEIR